LGNRRTSGRLNYNYFQTSQTLSFCQNIIFYRLFLYGINLKSSSVAVAPSASNLTKWSTIVCTSDVSA
jgi:hypothetical protein